MNEHEAMGKLVKEIADVLNQWRKCGRLEHTPDIRFSIYKKECPDILEITEGESAKSLITLILSAVRDGRLTLSEEEWRGRLEFGPTRQVDCLVVTKGHLAIKDGDAWEVIAHRFDRLGLRKEGTSKEEEA